MALNLVGWNDVLDSDNADKLSVFYEKLLGWTRLPGEEFTVLASIAQRVGMNFQTRSSIPSG